VVTLETINACEAIVPPVVGPCGSMELGGRFYVCAIGRNVTSFAVDFFFGCLIYFTKLIVSMGFAEIILQ
jgi:hypothetical protein